MHLTARPQLTTTVASCSNYVISNIKNSNHYSNLINFIWTRLKWMWAGRASPSGAWYLTKILTRQDILHCQGKTHSWRKWMIDEWNEPMIRNEMATQDIWNTLVVKDIQVKFGFKLISFLCKPYDGSSLMDNNFLGCVKIHGNPLFFLLMNRNILLNNSINVYENVRRRRRLGQLKCQKLQTPLAPN